TLPLASKRAERWRCRAGSKLNMTPLLNLCAAAMVFGEPGLSASVLRSSACNRYAGFPPAIVYAMTYKVRERRSITGVPSMPTLGPLLLQPSGLGTGAPRLTLFKIVPDQESIAYTVLPSVVAYTTVWTPWPAMF